jgi:hypothetical protein
LPPGNSRNSLQKRFARASDRSGNRSENFGAQCAPDSPTRAISIATTIAAEVVIYIAGAGSSLQRRPLARGPQPQKECTMSQITKVLYTAKTHTTGGHENGVSRSSDGLLDIRLSTPGSVRIGTNPEQLFAAGWSACLVSAIKCHRD